MKSVEKMQNSTMLKFFELLFLIFYETTTCKDKDGTRLSSREETTIPAPDIEFECGIAPFETPYTKELYMNALHNGKEYGPRNLPLYHLNRTMDELLAQGFTIQNEVVILEDVLCNFDYRNSTTSGSFDCYNVRTPSGRVIIPKELPALPVKRRLGVGGEPARIDQSYFMAQLGRRIGDEVTWLCDGVLINREWVLSAAHCFTKPTETPNFLRLGEHNLTVERDIHSYVPFMRKLVFDYPFAEIVPHPEFDVNQRYHDLVLIRIPKKFPRHATNVGPICLPWGEHTDKNLVSKNVSLMGWGATRFGGPKTDELQQVIMTVFETERCNENYRDLPGNKLLYPDGMTEDTILCIGWEAGGRDACSGDSGAPIVLEEPKKTNYLLVNTVDVLVGIVSGGFGCGLKDFPGLSIPINNPKYLQWIKDVAFAT